MLFIEKEYIFLFMDPFKLKKKQCWPCVLLKDKSKIIIIIIIIIYLKARLPMTGFA
jgi:hypothetical protein